MACYRPLDAHQVCIPGGHSSIHFGKPRSNSRAIQLPCGKCVGCRLKYSRDWAIRCMHEASLHQENSFVTLTYNDQSLPEGHTLVPSHLRDFLNQLRGRLAYAGEPRFRFYACGEYGGKTHRPHYHILFFGFEPKDKHSPRMIRGNLLYESHLLTKTWKKGFTQTGALTYESAAYVSRYIMKKITGPLANLHYVNVDQETGECFDLEPEFTRMSRGGKDGAGGIGLEWWRKYYETDILPTDSVVLKGREHRPPRFYDEQLRKIDPGAYDDIADARMRNAARYNSDNTKSRLHAKERVAELRLQRLPREMEPEQ